MNDRNESALTRLHMSSIPVKDIANQAWCEKQMEFYHLYGMKLTKPMQMGSAIHEDRQKIAYVKLEVEPATYPERLYKTAYENYMGLKNLSEKGICREFKVYGSINGFKIAGQIDELRIEKGELCIIEDKTLGRSGMTSRIKSDRIQLMIYKKLVDDAAQGLYTYENFSNAYKIAEMEFSPAFRKGLEDLGISPGMLRLDAIFKRMFEELRKLPSTSSILELRYFGRENGSLLSSVSVEYDKAYIDSELTHSMAYWSNEREAAPVPEAEKWKCEMCMFFKDKCNVWYDIPH